MNFADTNWLEAMFFELTGDQQSRRSIVDRFLRRTPASRGVSPNGDRHRVSPSESPLGFDAPCG